jgi:hypothetical protein
VTNTRPEWKRSSPEQGSASRRAAEELAKIKPCLRPRKPTEPIELGERGESKSLNLVAKLRQLAC